MRHERQRSTPAPMGAKRFTRENSSGAIVAMLRKTAKTSVMKLKDTRMKAARYRQSGRSVLATSTYHQQPRRKRGRKLGHAPSPAWRPQSRNLSGALGAKGSWMMKLGVEVRHPGAAHNGQPHPPLQLVLVHWLILRLTAAAVPLQLPQLKEKEKALVEPKPGMT